ncbi:MAG TPA: serine hydrolase domain-containing protein [Gemmatimonadaceae bacterium]
MTAAPRYRQEYMPDRKTASLLVAVLAMQACVETRDGSASHPIGTVSPAAWTRITEGMNAFLDTLETQEEYPPGAAVVIVTGDGRRFIRMHGETKAGSGYPATPETAFYIASMTKAFIGLLAARLDAEGVLPLETTLANVWPGLRLPDRGRQADAITLRDLLVHSIPFRAEEITFLEAYVRDVAPTEYPGLIERYAVARRDGFQYDNLGYNIYAAALEARTGRNWRVWLKEKVFLPLDMTATSGRTSDYPPDAIAWQHQRAGTLPDDWPRAGGWYLIAPKTDGMMQSAGGLMTSANDMALWLEAQVRGQGPPGSGLTTDIFTRARDDRVSQPSDGHGFSCDGYAYGWNVCSLIIRADEDLVDEDRVIGPFFQHGGGYVGVRALMTVAPRLGLAVAFLSNSDSMTGFLSQELTKLVFECLEDLPGEDARSRRRIADYRSRNARYLSALQDSLRSARANPRWKGWFWRPDAATLRGFVGSYEQEGALLPNAVVELSGDVLFLRHSDRRYRLTPAAPDFFGAQTFPYDRIDGVAFVRGPAGDVVGLDFAGQRYERRRLLSLGHDLLPSLRSLRRGRVFDSRGYRPDVAGRIAEPRDAVTPELVLERDQHCGAIGHCASHRRVNVRNVNEDDHWRAAVGKR